LNEKFGRLSAAFAYVSRFLSCTRVAMFRVETILFEKQFHYIVALSEELKRDDSIYLLFMPKLFLNLLLPWQWSMVK
jgi:hypothetical protein